MKSLSKIKRNKAPGEDDNALEIIKEKVEELLIDYLINLFEETTTPSM